MGNAEIMDRLRRNMPMSAKHSLSASTMSFVNETTDVNGNTLRLKQYFCSLSLPTTSDALFASLVLKYDKIPWQLFDDLLSLFQHGSFSSNDVSFKNTEDIYDTIACERAAAASRRTMAWRNQGEATTGGRVGRPPQGLQLVAELVSQYLSEQRTPYTRSTNITPGLHFVKDTIDEMLNALSLVHRCWTDSAQRCLRQRIQVKGYKNLRLQLGSPNTGYWVRELWFRDKFECHPNFEVDGPESPADKMQSMYNIIRRCPNIRHLVLDGVLSKDVKLSIGPTNLLGLLRSLEHLVLSQLAMDHDHLVDLCTALPELRHLKSLCIVNWGHQHDYESTDNSIIIPESLLEKSPFPSLKSLALVAHVGLKGQWPRSFASFFSWLVTPRTGYALRELELTYTGRGRHSLSEGNSVNLLNLLDPAASSLKKLRLYVPRLADVSSYIPLFTSLQYLSLIFDENTYEQATMTLPNCLRTLHIHYGFYTSPSRSEDSRLLSQLMASPCVRNLILTSPRDMNLTNFPQTNDHCILHSIEFTIQKQSIPPPFF